MTLTIIFIATFFCSFTGFFFSIIAEKAKATKYWYFLLVLSLVMLFFIHYKQTPNPPLVIELDGESITVPKHKQLM
jgi:hypothetical protein